MPLIDGPPLYCAVLAYSAVLAYCAVLACFTVLLASLCLEHHLQGCCTAFDPAALQPIRLFLLYPTLVYYSYTGCQKSGAFYRHLWR